MNVSEPSLITPIGIHHPDLGPTVDISITIEGNLFPIGRPRWTVVVIAVIAVTGQFSELASVSIYCVNMDGWTYTVDCRHYSCTTRKCNFSAVRRPCKCCWSLDFVSDNVNVAAVSIHDVNGEEIIPVAHERNFRPIRRPNRIAIVDGCKTW